jgi:hypothetical protein
MLKDVRNLLAPDPYYSGSAGFVGSSMEALHGDMNSLALPEYVPEAVRRYHDGIRNAYVYSYFSHDLLTLAASQTFPCLELALRLRIGHQFEGRLTGKGKPRLPVMLVELLEAAKTQGLIAGDVKLLAQLRNMFAHGSDTVLNAPMFLEPFKIVTALIADLFDPSRESPGAIV